MLRREFLTLVGSAAAWPLAARAQQGKMPTIGILSPSTREREGDLLEAFTRSLRQAGYVDGQNIAVEHRFADDRFDRLPALASDLVRRDVAVIVTLAGTIAALAAKSVTQTIPIVFITGAVARLSVPAVFGYRNFAAAGGLMSYGTSPHDARRQAALLVARILQGEKPAELPVQRATKVELVINLKTAKTLGLSFPLALLGRADEVIE